MFYVDDDAAKGAAWIPAGEARALAAHSFSSPYDASEFIVRRAGANRIRSHSARMQMVSSEFENGQRVCTDCLISSEFWQEFELHSARKIEEWPSGDFELRTNTFDTPTKHVRLIGARFSKTDLLAELPTREVVWMPARDALALVREHNGRHGAETSIATRAHVGILRTHARLLKHEVDGHYGQKQQLADPETELPKEFWWAEGHAALEANWRTGDFATWINKTYQWQAFGVEFDRNGIEAMLAPKLEPKLPSTAVMTDRSSGGRRPAKQWADFAEELTVYIHDTGLPEGQNSEGQGFVIDAVFKRMQEAGKDEPSRATVQSVVSAVLQRIRSAGN